MHRLEYCTPPIPPQDQASTAQCFGYALASVGCFFAAVLFGVLAFHAPILAIIALLFFAIGVDYAKCAINRRKSNRLPPDMH